LLAHGKARGYIPGMHRSTTLRVIGAVLVIGIGAYSIFWWIAAGRIKDEARKWAEAAPQQKIDVSWKTMRVAGYPFAFRLELTDAVLRSAAPEAPGEVHAPRFSISVAPWDFHSANAAASDGIAATLGAAGAPIGKLEAAKASAAYAMGRDGESTLWLSLFEMKASSGDEISARLVHGWFIVPGTPPTSHTEPAMTIAMMARDLEVPVAPTGFGKTIDELAFGFSVMGALSPGPPRQVAAAWRDAGGTVELDNFRLRWGETSISGTGTLALDNDLQPIGGFSGGIAGYDQLMKALVAAGRVKSNDARVARLALAMIAKAGPDGRPEITSSLTIQNGEIFLGPAKLGKMPRLNW
jgi:hypothetical protein